MCVVFCPSCLRPFVLYHHQHQHPSSRLIPCSADNGKRYFYLPASPSSMYLTQEWILPAGVTCPNGCLLQWWVPVREAWMFRVHVGQFCMHMPFCQ